LPARESLRSIGARDEAAPQRLEARGLRVGGHEQPDAEPVLEIEAGSQPIDVRIASKVPSSPSVLVSTSAMSSRRATSRSSIDSMATSRSMVTRSPPSRAASVTRR
jgi:hypothetical protein